MIEVIQLRTHFTLKAETGDVVSFCHHFEHQHFEPHITKGPTFNPNFHNRAWTFNAEGVDMLPVTEMTPSVKKTVLSDLASLFLGALNQY